MIDPACKEVMKSLALTTFVETGLDMAETVAAVSRWFAESDPDFGTVTGSITTGARAYNAWNEEIQYPQFENVENSKYEIHSVDLHQYSYANACKIFENNSNIHFHLQSSEEFLQAFVDEKIKTDSAEECFFFFDAHWRKYWPLLDELRAISRLDRFVVCIDDVFVPGKSDARRPRGDYGYEVHRGVVLDWAYVRPVLEGVKKKVFYSANYNRDKRGWMLIFGGYTDEELAQFRGDKFFEMDDDDPAHTSEVQLSPLAKLDLKSIIKQVIPLDLLRTLVRLYHRLT
jgi:hypothetical protein